MPAIFISYRREDSIAYSGRLYDRLTAEFGKGQVFMDIDSMDPGSDFVDVIERTVAACDAVLVVIGKQWLSASDAQGRPRIENPEDFVRLEVGTALSRKVRVVPVLVGGAQMPRPDQLPAALAGLSRRNALDLPDIAFHQTLGRLVDLLRRGETHWPKPAEPASGARLPRWALAALVTAALVVSAVVYFGKPSRPAPIQETASTPAVAARLAERSTLRTGQTKVNPKDGLTYVWIPAGTFIMGCSPGDGECRGDEIPAHEVTLTIGFWMGQTPVTQQAYQLVMGENPSHPEGAQLPVVTVNWLKAQSYCQAVGMRLPTEAEWEYAARAGSVTSRYGDLDKIAWYSANSGGKAHEVGQKPPNAWGLYDMLGNVWQWTADWYTDKYSGTSQTDPHGPASGTFRPLRGGCWSNDPSYVRVSYRVSVNPESRTNDVGFRCLGN
jgi:formylglycine-generating enzyme required for sulfatase activity